MEAEHRGPVATAGHSHYLSDDPIASRRLDALGRAAFASAVARVISAAALESSVVIGIYGEWGEGKTSVLNMLDEVLRDKPNIVSRRFNPWRFQDEDLQLRELFEVLAEAAEAKLEPKRSKISRLLEWIASPFRGLGLYRGREKIGRLLRRIAPLLKGVNIEGGSAMGGARVSPGDAADALGARLERHSIDEVRIAVNEYLKELDRRIVILIDDVDRLDRDEIHTLMRVLKVSCDFSNTVYVLACDDGIVAASIGARYAEGGPEAGRGFLEKIVQIPLRLPMPDRLALLQLNLGSIWNVLESVGARVSEEEWQRFLRYYRIAIEPASGTIRSGKRYANALAVTLPLVGEDVNVVDFLLIEGLRVFYPALYQEIESRVELLVASRESGPGAVRDEELIRNAFERGVGGVPMERHDGLRQLVAALFPFVSPAFGGSRYGRDFMPRWTREKRVTSRRYASRFFALQVPVTDVGDREIEGVFTLVASGELDGATEALKPLLTGANAGNVVERVWERAPQFEGGSAGRLAVVVARVADKLPEEDALVYSTSNTAAIAIRQLLWRIDRGPARVEWTKKVLEESSTVTFAIECARGLVGDSDGGDALIDDDGKRQLREVVVGRIRSELYGRVSELGEGRRLMLLMSAWAWWGNIEEVRRFFGERIERNPDNARRIVMAFAGKATALETQIVSIGRIMRDSYDAIVRCVSADIVVDGLRKTYGGLLMTDSDEGEGNVSEELRVAREFVRIHEAVKREMEVAEGGTLVRGNGGGTLDNERKP